MSISTRVLSLTLAGIVMVPAASAAQTASSMTFGVKAGINSSSITFEDAGQQADVKRLLGAVGGVFLGKRISDNIGLRVEGLFSQKGAKDAESGDDAELRLTYIDVPVLLTLGPAATDGARFSAFTGPQFSFRTKAEETFLGQTQDVSDDVEGNDFGWVIGAGVEMNRFNLDARYAHGLKDIAIGAAKVKNRVFSVMVGVNLSK